MINQDLKQIGELLDRRFDRSEQRFDKKLSIVVKGLRQESAQSAKKVTEGLRQEIRDSETRLEKKIVASEERIYNGIGDFINDNLIPLIAEKSDKTDIDRLERKIDRLIDKDIEQDRRLDRIEVLNP